MSPESPVRSILQMYIVRSCSKRASVRWTSVRWTSVLRTSVLRTYLPRRDARAVRVRYIT